MYPDMVHLGFSEEDIKNHVNFKRNISQASGKIKLPTDNQLDLLYDKVDLEGIFL